MEALFDFWKRNKILIVIVSLIAGLTVGYLLISTPHAENVTKELKTDTKESNKKSVATNTTKKRDLVIDIEGAVKSPGVYHVKNGAIVQEALKEAGGVNRNADTKQLNKAKRVTDQMQLYVPSVGEHSGNSNSSTASETKVVNINSATVADFKDVTGIGPKKAEKIIAFREKNGDFQTLHDLTKVSGIGEKSLDSLKDQLTV